jgi:hypothetical protein
MIAWLFVSLVLAVAVTYYMNRVAKKTGYSVAPDYYPPPPLPPYPLHLDRAREHLTREYAEHTSEEASKVIRRMDLAKR